MSFRLLHGRFASSWEARSNVKNVVNSKKAPMPAIKRRKYSFVTFAIISVMRIPPIRQRA
jgi:hypothetical protein